MARIELRGVSKRFPDGTIALRKTDLVVEDGELFVLVGPSGCGKSTLLNLIAGLEAPSGGEIFVDGRAVNGVDPKDRNIAMVFQNYALYPHMTVRDNIAFPLRMAGKPRPEIVRRVEQTAALLELGPLLDRRPQELSGGQRQRVAMGRALVREPAAFLLDEPLSNLDARLRVQTRAEIARLRKRLGATMIHVTHDQTEALTLGDRIAVMEGGAVSQVGTPRELYDAPRNRFVAGFIGEPAMNFLPGEIRDGRLLLPIGTYPLSERLPAASGDVPRRVIAGFRPGDVQVAAGHAPDAAFEAIVDVLEWTGADLHARLRLNGGDTEIIVRLERTSEVREGERLMLAVAGERMHLFDEASGENLRNHSLS